MVRQGIARHGGVREPFRIRRSARPRVPGPGGTRAERKQVRHGTDTERRDAGAAVPEGYLNEASAKISCVSGETLGGLTSSAKAMDGGELETGTPGR